MKNKCYSIMNANTYFSILMYLIKSLKVMKCNIPLKLMTHILQNYINFKINVFLLCSFYHPSDLAITTSQFELILLLIFFCFKNIYFRQCHLIFCISGDSKWQCLFGGQCVWSRKVVRCEHTCQGTHCSGHIIVSLHMLSI